MRTMRLPEAVDEIDRYADFLAAQVESLSDYVLVGDSFGAVISLALAIRQPTGLRGLVLSGGFAANPLPHWKAIAGRASRYAGGPLYRQGTLRVHARELASRFDHTAEVPHRQADYRRLFVENTPRASYTARVTSVISFDVREQLAKVSVPTLLITPADDRLVGAQAAQELRQGIPNAREAVLPRTGHMFRFTHPNPYGQPSSSSSNTSTAQRSPTITATAPQRPEQPSDVSTGPAVTRNRVPAHGKRMIRPSSNSRRSCHSHQPPGHFRLRHAATCLPACRELRASAGCQSAAKAGGWTGRVWRVGWTV